MTISGKRILSIVITAVLTAGSVKIVYDQYRQQKPEKEFTQQERRAHLYKTYKKEFQSRISDSAVLERYCACLADTIIKRFSDKELGELDKLPEQEQLRRVGDINDYCRKKSGLDSLLNNR